MEFVMAMNIGRPIYMALPLIAATGHTAVVGENPRYGLPKESSIGGFLNRYLKETLEKRK